MAAILTGMMVLLPRHLAKDSQRQPSWRILLMPWEIHLRQWQPYCVVDVAFSAGWAVAVILKYIVLLTRHSAQDRQSQPS